MKVIDVKKLRPNRGLVLVKEDVVKEVSGIYLPKEDRQYTGVVIAVGEAEFEGQKLPCKKGDKVIFKRWVANELKDKDDLYLFLKFEEIFAVMK